MNSTIAGEARILVPSAVRREMESRYRRDVPRNLGVHPAVSCPLSRAQYVLGPRELSIHCHPNFLRNSAVLPPRDALGSPGRRW